MVVEHFQVRTAPKWIEVHVIWQDTLLKVRRLSDIYGMVECVECGKCLTICPARNPIAGKDGRAFALRCNDTSLLQKSSSGGAFSLLAQQVLEKDGLVCGAAFDECFHVRHILSQDIAPMRKAKYVQSDLSGIYQALREALDQGRQGGHGDRRLRGAAAQQEAQGQEQQRQAAAGEGELHACSSFCRRMQL